MYNNSINVIGLMSGTSLDGVDICLVSFENLDNTKYNIVFAKTFVYSKIWIKKLKESILLNKKELNKLDIEYGNLLSEYVKKFIKEFSITKIDIISSHGNTIFHEPEKGITLQIGNGNTINKNTKIQVISDFRSQDISYKGQGAPLVPIGDLKLFPNYKFCLNLGGFSNISIKNFEGIKAFDICPVNTVLNHDSKKLGYELDKNGVLSNKGTTNLNLLKKLNQMEFNNKSGPKSLGIEIVNSKILPLIEKFSLNPNDILRTYIEHISDQINRSVTYDTKNKILITGGGAYNQTLINAIKIKVKSEIIIPEKKIIDFKEAMIFAYMGLLRSKGEVNCLKSVTGALKDHSSGKVFKN